MGERRRLKKFAKREAKKAAKVAADAAEFGAVLKAVLNDPGVTAELENRIMSRLQTPAEGMIDATAGSASVVAHKKKIVTH